MLAQEVPRRRPGLAALPIGPQQEYHLRRAVQFMEKALGALSFPEDPDEVDERDRPSPCACCHTGEGVVGCWDRAYDVGFKNGYREAAQHPPRFRAGD